MPELIAKVRASKKLIVKNDSFLGRYQSEEVNIPIFCEKMIKIKNVTAGYAPSEDILQNISFTFGAKGCYAIIGESGSGKTTLLNIISGVQKNYSGEITYDDVDIKNISDESLFKLVSVIYQDIFIFDTTIKNNITMFGHSNEAMLDDAVYKSGLKEIVADKGIDYMCGENGNRLSGGEKQRIAIARSILSNTDVLFLDEATSALDVQTGHQIIDIVQQLKDKTRIIVTHDIYPDLMNNFDCIIVLKDGKIAETGCFSELMAKRGVCYDLIAKGQ